DEGRGAKGEGGRQCGSLRLHRLHLHCAGDRLHLVRYGVGGDRGARRAAGDAARRCPRPGVSV
ncbi:MAG: hypothetical protein AVDCRST_MAG88-4002, partial [uncultured Thermomicrobiales bacterium]